MASQAVIRDSEGREIAVLNIPNGASEDQIMQKISEIKQQAIRGSDGELINDSGAGDIQRPLAERLVGGLETAGTVLSGAVAEPASGLAGLTTAALTGDPLAAQAVQEGVSESLTFQPRTEAGQESLESVAGFVEPVVSAISDTEKALGDATFDATGSPALAAAATTIPTLATEVLGVFVPTAAARGLRGVDKSIKSAKRGLKEAKITRELDEALPTSEQLRNTSSAVFDEIDTLGVRVKPKAFTNFVNKLEREASASGLDKTNTPKANRAIQRFTELRGAEVPLGELDKLRAVAQSAASDVTNATESALGVGIINSIDEFLDGLPENSLSQGQLNKEAVSGRYRIARDLWGRAKRSELLQEAFSKANLQASGFENGIRTQFRSILNNKKQRRFFTEPEKAAMKKVVEGDKSVNLAKLVGRLGFSEGGATNILGGLGGVAAGGAVAGGPGALIVPIIGQVSRKLAQRMTKDRAEFADKVIRAGRDGRKITEAYLDNTPKNEISSSELSELLMRPDIDLSGLPEGALIDDAARMVVERNEALLGAGATVGALGAQESLEEQ